MRMCRTAAVIFASLLLAGTGRAAEPGTQANLPALRLAIEDLAKTFGNKYVKGPEYLRRLEAYESRWDDLAARLAQGDLAAKKEMAEILAFQREALLANPLLDFDKLLIVKRKPKGDPRRPKGEGFGLGEFLGLPRQSSWQQDTIPKRDGWENEIAVLSGLRGPGTVTRLFQPPRARLAGDIDLDFDAGRILFSMPDDDLLWQVCQIAADGGSFRQLTPKGQPGIHNFDACYLPDGGIAFASTAPLQGVPCNATVNVATAYRMDADGRSIRQLGFDQDHNYCLTPMNDGRLLYLRWEYTDLPHVWARRLFTMNPDGTGQREFYGSGGFWPNAIFYARPVPGQPTRVVGIVTGHHVGRVGELVIFDAQQGRTAASGVVQRIPGHGKPVEPRIEDRLTEESWPKFLHPYPLSDKYFLVAAKPGPTSLWGIYLVDVFDNMTLVKEEEGYALLEPIPIQPRLRPSVIPSKVDCQRSDAVIYLEDVYAGPGLQGVPRGAVKQLRLFTYHFGYQGLAGISHRVGADGPWEPKRVLGTVPVEADGSALFRVPANTPISIQPLDAEGHALQLMRSWATAMPGETVSCVGCHESQNSGPPGRNTLAATRAPREIAPFYGPTRGFSFLREIQPVLDRHCVACHDGRAGDDGQVISDLRADQGRLVVVAGGDPRPRVVSGSDPERWFPKYAGVFPPSYIELRRFVRVGGFESDIRLLAPGEFHANTSELMQMLRKGHYGVQLDEESLARLSTWIDLNAPCHGTWRETVGAARTARDHLRRIELRKLYGGPTDDPEAAEAPPATAVATVTSVAGARTATTAHPKAPHVDGWPFDADEARRRQAAAGAAARVIDLGGGVSIDMVRIPAGRFVLGDPEGEADQQPPTVVEIQQPFWMSRCEVTNEQYGRFDPSHDSRYEHKGSWSFSERHLGWPLGAPRQPVVRVSQREAAAFCAWLSQKANLPVDLPTEAQWEYACRAGSDRPFSYGGVDNDFSPFANMADASIRQLAYDTDGRYTMDLVPRDERFNDKALVSSEVGAYRPNAWGLCDMHGNVWEWTRSAYRPYPYRDDDGRNDAAAGASRVVRGGSWYDRPKRCRSAFRLSYPDWQKVYNVGFRIIATEPAAAAAVDSGRN